MNSRRLGLLALLALGFLHFAATVGAADKEMTIKRPNVIIILVDDMGYGDVGAFNPHCRNKTPNIDRMARAGLKLTSFYAAPVCTPSRAQLLTGCYAKRVSLPVDLFPAQGIGLNREEHTIASLLKKQGYATMAIGNWHLGDQPKFLPGHFGFDHFLGLPYSNDMGGEWDGGAKAPGDGHRYPPLPLLQDDVVVATLRALDQDKLEELYTAEAVKFIEDHRAGPFFLYLPHTAVHVPLHPGREFAGKSSNGRYGDWCLEVDASTGQILDELHELKIEKNTLVLFTSDTGPWLIPGRDSGSAGPLSGGRGSTYEGGMREPTIAWWPGHIKAGTSTDAVAGEIDLLPTIVKLAGGAVPRDRKIDGADLLPLLLGKASESPRPCQYYFNGNELQAIRAGPWKLAIAPQKERGAKKLHSPKPDEAFEPVLYNLQADIGETTNVASDHPEVVKRLLDFAEKMDADLGRKEKGPGVRPAGEVENPKPLLLKE